MDGADQRIRIRVRGDQSRWFGGHDGLIDGNCSREAWGQG